MHGIEKWQLRLSTPDAKPKGSCQIIQKGLLPRRSVDVQTARGRMSSMMPSPFPEWKKSESGLGSAPNSQKLRSSEQPQKPSTRKPSASALSTPKVGLRKFGRTITNCLKKLPRIYGLWPAYTASSRPLQPQPYKSPTQTLSLKSRNSQSLNLKRAACRCCSPSCPGCVVSSPGHTPRLGRGLRVYSRRRV